MWCGSGGGGSVDLVSVEIVDVGGSVKLLGGEKGNIGGSVDFVGGERGHVRPTLLVVMFILLVQVVDFVGDGTGNDG